MTNRSSLLALFAASFLVSVGACSCDDPPVAGADSLPELEPASLVFAGEACAGSAAKQTVLVSNKSRGQLTGTFSIEGKDAEDFRIADEDREISLGGLGSKEIEVFFVPRAPSSGKGPKALEAALVLRSNSERQPEVDATLDGQVSNLPLEPDFASEWEVCRPGTEESPRVDCPAIGEPLTTCCRNGRGQHFGQISVDESATARLSVSNPSCGELIVNEVFEEILSENDDCGEGVLTWPDLKLEPLSVAGQGSEEFAVTFTPTKQCDLHRQITLHSNSSKGSLTFVLHGKGIQGILDYIPDSLIFGTVAQGQSATRSTIGYNRGGEAVLIHGIRIEGPSKEHFRFVSVQHCGNEVDLAGLVDEPLELLQKDAECERSVSFVVEYAPKGPGIHNDSSLFVEHNLGMDKVPLNGRSSPKLVVIPDVIAFDTPAETGCGGADDHACGTCKNQTATACVDDGDCQVDEACLDGICTFDEALCITTCGQASRSFRLVNEGVGDLVIAKLSLEDSEGKEGGPRDPMRDSDTYNKPIFKVDEGTCKNATVKPGESCEGRIDVVDNRSGGMIEAILRVESNDPSWDGGMPVDIFKNSVSPVAPDVRFPKPSFPTVNQWVRLDASQSSAKQGTLTRFEWELSTVQTSTKLPRGKIDPKNPNSGCGRPDGECYRLLNSSEAPCAADGSDCSILEFKPDIAIVYTVKVTAEGSICSPPYDRSWSDDISPVAH